MMAGWGVARALLLVLLTDWSYSNYMNPGAGVASGAVSNPGASRAFPPSLGAFGRAGTEKLGSSGSDPQPLGVVSRSDYSVPQYQAGELIQEEKTFEKGNYDSKTEEGGIMPAPPSPPVYAAQPSPAFSGGPVQPGLVGRSNPYPNYDYMFLTGQYPPGTYIQASKTFEQGKDRWENAHYTGDHYARALQARRHRAVRQVGYGENRL